MTPEEIEACIGLMARHGVAAFSWSRGEETLSLRGAAGGGAGAGAGAASPGPAPGGDAAVRAPAAGVFRAAHPATGQPMAGEGEAVRAGQVVGLLQVGPCLRPAVAAAAGVLGEAVAADGALVGFGAELFAPRGGA